MFDLNLVEVGGSAELSGVFMCCSVVSGCFKVSSLTFLRFSYAACLFIVS